MTNAVIHPSADNAGTVRLRITANGVKEAIRLCRLAERLDVGLELLEQPVAAWDLQGMAAVRRAVDTLVDADESCYTMHDALCQPRPVQPKRVAFGVVVRDSSFGGCELIAPPEIRGRFADAAPSYPPERKLDVAVRRGGGNRSQHEASSRTCEVHQGEMPEVDAIRKSS